MTDLTTPGTTGPDFPFWYTITYYIVDRFGELVFRGHCDISQDRPMPADDEEAEQVLMWAKTAKMIRASCDRKGFPAGRVLVAAAEPASDYSRLSTAAVRLRAELRAATSEAERNRVDGQIRTLTGNDPEAAAWLRRQVRSN